MRQPICLALAAAITAIGLGVHGSPSGFAAVVATLGGEKCDVYCHEDCEPGSHNALDLVSTPANATGNGGVHLDGQCRSGSCDTMHGPLCEERQMFAAADVEAVRLAILYEDAQAIRAAVATDGSPFHLSADRKAIQVADCTGEFVAHFPVPDRLFDRILTD